MRGLTLLVSLAGLAVPLSASAQLCRDGRPPSAHLGIESFECRASSCWVNRPAEGTRVHDFRVEPIVHPDTAAGSPLRDGDVLVAVNGMLVTTPEAGRLLANLSTEAPVTLSVRRKGTAVQFTMMPLVGCNTPRLVVHGGSAVVAPGRRPPAPVSFGMTLSCARCGWGLDGAGRLTFDADGPLPVLAVTPGRAASRAAIAPGDVLVAVDGLALGSPAASRRLGSLAPGDGVMVDVRRFNTVLRVHLIAEKSLD
jgi:S1-C subfamily serine protease